MIEWIGTFIEGIMDLPLLGVAAFFFFSGLIEIIFQPWPGTTILVFGGCLSGMGYDAGWIAVGLMFFLGEALGTLIVFEFGAHHGARLLQWKWVRRIYSENMQRRAEQWVQKFGVGMLFIAKFTAGVNTAADLFGGIMRFPRIKAYPAMLSACFLHNLLFFFAGNRLGDSWEAVVAFMAENNWRMIGIVALLLAAYVAYKLIARWWNRRQKIDDGDPPTDDDPFTSTAKEQSEGECP